MSDGQILKTAIHELSHAILHSEENNKKDRSLKELEAESVAYVVCNHFDIDTSEYSFGYLAGWSKDKELKELKLSLETIKNQYFCKQKPKSEILFAHLCDTNSNKLN